MTYLHVHIRHVWTYYMYKFNAFLFSLVYEFVSNNIFLIHSSSCFTLAMHNNHFIMFYQ